MSLLKPASLTPYLSIDPSKKAADALAWYQKVFGAKVTEERKVEGTDKIFHAELDANGNKFMLSDFGRDKGVVGCSTTLCIACNSPEDVDKQVEVAVAEGATVTMPVNDQFWGDRFGSIVDPFGNNWSFLANIDEERRAKAQAKWDEQQQKQQGGGEGGAGEKRGAEDGAEDESAKKKKEESA